MKAFVIQKYGSVDDIEPVEMAIPAVGDDQVLVRVKAAAVNPADLKVITGKNGGKFIHSAKSPIGLGFDFSGVIEQVGDRVTGFKPADAVFGFLPYSRKTRQGSFAEYVVVNSATIARKPASISHTEAAAAATTASTALQALVSIGGIKPGQKVLINGASGGVGSYAVRIAKEFQTEVWGTGSAANLDYLKSIGADRAIDYRKTTLGDIPETFDMVFDVASNSSFGQCQGILAPGGVYITLMPSLGLLTGKVRAFLAGKKCALCIVQPKTENLARIADLMAKQVISNMVTAVYPVSELPDALRKFAAGGVRGKIGIVVEE